ncbi:MAG: DUF86 domain-containing protein [bacterium]|nr:DUF86 domain-containing protein [bacterium]
MIRKDFVKRKISLIQDDLSNLTKFSDLSFDDITKDSIKQAAVERFLERIINRAIDINQHLIGELVTKDTSSPKDYKETFSTLSDLKVYPREFSKEISKSIGARNKLAHEYDNVDYSVIYQSIADCLRDYHKYCDYILDFLESN